jgi:Do/DeqQ family serine protease
MKILGQFIIALIGGIVAILIYRTFDQQSTSSTSVNRVSNPLGRNISYNSSTVDSINNVFTVGFGEAAESTLKQVVHIRSRIATRAQRNPFYEFFGDGFYEQQYENKEWQQEQLQEASGSGVIVSNDGYIVTNNHVIDDAQEVIVSTYNGREYKATVVGADPSTDIAVIKIDEKNLPKAGIADSDKVRVGDWVIAVGNPFNLASTVTAGIVSAKARNIHILSDNSAIESFIQTDAAVNPGNSGGALVNLRGELIGINTAIATPTGTFAGYAFAVPSNIVKRVMTDLIENGKVDRGYLGVVIEDLSSQLAREMGVDLSQGVVVVNLAQNGSAHKAGVKVKDIILEVEGAAIQNTPQLLEILASRKPGDELNVVVLRDGKRRNISIRLQQAKELQGLDS